MAKAQRGAAALITVALLCLAALLALGTVATTTSTQRRSARHTERSATAFQAAEAGLDWALAHLDDPRSIDADCLSPAHPGAGAAVVVGSDTAFASRLLAVDPANGMLTPKTTVGAGGVSSPLQPACTRTDPGWRCLCPDTSAAMLSAASDDQPRATFRVHVEAASAPRTAQLVSDGCSQPAGNCAPSNGEADATVQTRMLIGLLPALVSLPSAALTVVGSAAGGAALGAHNPDAAAGGVAVQAGGSIDLPNARLTGAAGAASGAERIAGDGGLAGLDFEHLVRRLTTLNTARWREPPAVQTVSCLGDCGAALIAAAAAMPGPALLWVDGDATLLGPMTLGTDDRPVMLLASGRIGFTGDVHLTGLVLSGELAWHADASGSSGSLRGAALSAGSYGGDGTPEITYDRTVLRRLRAVGRYAKVAGSWQDF